MLGILIYSKKYLYIQGKRMGNNNSRQLTYSQYYNYMQQYQNQNHAVGNEGANPLPNPETIDMSQVNPYEVLNVPRNFEWEQLKNAYRHAASLVHPDKGGNRHIFNLVTECFRYLANEYKARDADKPHYLLKQQSQDYISQQYGKKDDIEEGKYVHRERDRDIRVNPSVMDGNTLNKFNKLFEENRLDDEEIEHGYGNMMTESSKNREDINVPKLMKKFEASKFNKVFDKVAPVSKDVIVYKEPEPLQLAKNLQYTEIGASKPNDYSSSIESSIQYTDYMKAHTTARLVDPRTIGQRKEFKTVEQYENARTKFTEKPLTPEEIRKKKEKEEQEKLLEEKRLLRVKERDQIAADHYERMNRLLLG